MPWPPQVEDLIHDLGPEYTAADAPRLYPLLDAAVAYVERQRRGDLNFVGVAGSTLPAPGPDVVLGTLRLAGRQLSRRNSPDGVITLGADLGVARVARVDPDIEQMLGVGAYREPMV